MRIMGAHAHDIPALELLIPLSVRALQSSYYSSAQIEAAIGSIFGVDRQLIRDRTYFIAKQESKIVGCGGWSKRKKLFGGDGIEAAENAVLDPKCDSARIRAFFVHPAWARQGVGRAILNACEEAIRGAHFQSAELVATSPGEPFFAAFGYAAVEHYEVPLSSGLSLPVVRMTRIFVPVREAQHAKPGS